MGGEVNDSSGRGSFGLKPSPHRFAIEKAQAELRQEYDVREEKRRELEFLEKGGNPLDFKFCNATSHSVQSTSLFDKQQADRFVKSEVKDSFPRTISQQGDSVESSGRLEPNTADNLLLFDAGNKSLGGERNSKYPNKRSRTSESEQSLRVNNLQNTKEVEDSAIFRPYARRNRTKVNRDPARSSSTELVQSRGGLAKSLSLRKESVDVKGSDSDAAPRNLLKTEDDGLVVRESTAATKRNPVKEKVDIAYRKSSADVAFRQTCLTRVKIDAVSASTVADSPSAVLTCSQETNSTQVNGLTDLRGEKESLNDSKTVGEKGINRESTHANNVEVDVDTKDLYRVDQPDSNRIAMQSDSKVEVILNPTAGEMVSTQSEDKAGNSTIITSDQLSAHQNQTKSLKIENQDPKSTLELHNEKKCSETEGNQQDDSDILQNDMKVTSGLADTSDSSLCLKMSQAAANTCIVRKNVLSGPGDTTLKHQDSLGPDPRMLDALKEKEDSVLEAARTIEANRKRIAELSLGTVPVEIRTRSQWDFVLEEMAWLANDFAQERLWKMTAAMQICHRVAFTSQLKLEERNQHRKLKSLASTLANAVLQFWNSVEVPRELEETSLGTDKETGKESKCDSGRNCSTSGVAGYARRFLKLVKPSTPLHQATAPLTPENICDPGILETSWDDQLTEESLFYSVPSGAMEAYRSSIESHLVCEHYSSQKSGSSMQEEVETSAYDAAEDTGYNGYEEDEDETSPYYLPGALECSKSFNSTHRKRKNSMKYRSAPSYDIGAGLPYGSSNPLVSKRPASNLNVGSVPMKRMRTAPKHRIVSSFGSGTVGYLPAPSKTDASSGDTSSFQDEQSSLNGGSAIQRGTEVDSTGNYEKQLPYDMADTSRKPKKKKGSAYDQAWHPDSVVHGEQDHWKKRPDNHFSINGTYGPHSSKKQKTTKYLVENNFDNVIPGTGPIPSSAASQMSNMPNPNKFIKFIGGRDKGRKINSLKISSGQQGCENPWTLFEDQALVVLVHDMGPNWELTSDAINSTLKIRCIYRNPSECKERHKILMDKSCGDGADSAEDSGNSQSYSFTLPGIPKGSARQLFQRLQGPVEEDTLKSHFEKICSIGKKFQCRKIQNDGRDPKQIVPVHNSQVMALSHVFPNNLNGSVLTPLDLCDASTSGQDLFSLEPLLNQGTSVLPAAEANPSITGSTDVVPGNNLSTVSVPSSASSRFSFPRGSLPPVEQYNQMLSGRNLQQPSLSTPGAVSGPDLGNRLPGGNAMSVNGINRGTPLSRPGFQGVSSLAVPSAGSMLSSAMGGNINSTGSASPGNSTLRPRGAMHHMIRMQAAKGNGQGIPALSSGFTNQTTPPLQAYPGHLSHQHQLSQQSHGLGNPHKSYLQSPNHAAGTQQQAYAIRQRQMHQRFLQKQKQQLQQFPAAAAMTPHVQSQHQVPPVTSSPKNSPQTQPAAPSQPLSMPLSSTSPNMTAIAQQRPQKPQFPVNGVGKNPQSGASGVNNQAVKQRQRQLQQQSGRQHPYQRQPTQGLQQNKLLKGMGRGNIMHQSISVDPSHMKGATMSPGILGTEKVEATVQAVPDQPSNPVTAMSLHPQSKSLNSPQFSSTSQQQPKTISGALSPTAQQDQQRQLYSDNNIPDENSAEVPGNILSTSSPSVTPAVAQPNHQHLLLHQKRGNQVQPTPHRTVHQDHDSSKMSQAEHSPRNPESVTNTIETASMGKIKGVTGDNIVSTTAVAPIAINSPPKELGLSSCDSEHSDIANEKSSTESASVPDMAQGLDLSPDGFPGDGHKDGTERQQQQQSPLIEQRQPQLSEELLAQNRKHIPTEQPQHESCLKTLELEAVHEKPSSMPPDTMVE